MLSVIALVRTLVYLTRFAVEEATVDVSEQISSNGAQMQADRQTTDRVYSIGQSTSD